MGLIAERMRLLDSSGIRKVFDLAAKLSSPINLSIGQPDFDVPEPVKQAAVDAIRAGRNRYTVTQGIDELRDAIAERLRRELGWRAPSVLVTSGVSGALLLAALVLIEPGDEVLMPDPYFVMYPHHVNLCGGKVVYVDTYPDFQLTVERLERAVTERSKVLFLNSPANPTGAVLGELQLRAIAELADRRGLIVLADEIYEKFCYDGPHHSIGSYGRRVLLTRGFSKSHAMTGWRLGYIATDSDELRPVIEKMTMLQQYSFVCAPSTAQYAGLVALDTDVRNHIDAYRRKRDMVVRILGERFSLSRPSGAFYAFVEAPAGDADRFVERAIANNVLIIPGKVFSRRNTHFRLSYATDERTLRKGLELLCKLADESNQ